jgi:5'-3' exonuclease
MSVSFKSTVKEKDKSTILVVDALNLSFRYKHAGISEFSEHMLSTIMSLSNSYGAGTVIVACDNGSSSYRMNLLETYKSGRKEKFANQTEDEKQAAKEFFEGFEKALTHISKSVPVLRFDKVEADDIAAYIVKHKDKYGYRKVWLISSDKDWDLLVDEEVSRFSYVTRKEVTIDNWPYEVEPLEYLTYKCLTGDSGDSVPGVPQIGPKRASEIIQHVGDIYSIINALPLIGKQKYIQNLNQSKDLLELNIKLMDLLGHCEDALGANTGSIDKVLEEYKPC